MQEEVKEYLAWIRASAQVSNTSQLVSIHVRRDDYQKVLGRLVAVDFFRRAIDVLKKILRGTDADDSKASAFVLIARGCVRRVWTCSLEELIYI